MAPPVKTAKFNPPQVPIQAKLASCPGLCSQSLPSPAKSPAYRTSVGSMRKPQLARNVSRSTRISAPVFKKGFPRPDLKATPSPNYSSPDRHMNIDRPNHRGDSNFDGESTSLDDEDKAPSSSPPVNAKDEDKDDGGNGDNEGASEGKGCGGDNGTKEYHRNVILAYVRK
ncbi:hypothetical protein FRC12_019052 [Ceratobasidium sp. 428]|nr:hypothetical protein FRC12_019052 [Ceratobasidium sp. 428]